MSTTTGSRELLQVDRRERRHVRVGSGADPDHGVPEQVAVASASGRSHAAGNGATPPGSNPVACTTSSALATRTSFASSSSAIARSIGPGDRRDEREHVGAVTDEHE